MFKQLWDWFNDKPEAELKPIRKRKPRIKKDNTNEGQSTGIRTSEQPAPIELPTELRTV